MVTKYLTHLTIEEATEALESLCAAKYVLSTMEAPGWTSVKRKVMRGHMQIGLGLLRREFALRHPTAKSGFDKSAVLSYQKTCAFNLQWNPSNQDLQKASEILGAAQETVAKLFPWADHPVKGWSKLHHNLNTLRYGLEPDTAIGEISDFHWYIWGSPGHAYDELMAKDLSLFPPGGALNHSTFDACFQKYACLMWITSEGLTSSAPKKKKSKASHTVDVDDYETIRDEDGDKMHLAGIEHGDDWYWTGSYAYA